MLPYATENKDGSQDSDFVYEVDKESKKIKWHHWLLLNRPLKVVIVLLLATIAAPVLLYNFVFFNTLNLPPSDGFSIGSCYIPRQSRLPCGYGNVTADQCHTECCYDTMNGFCFHKFPSRFSYILKEEWTEDVLLTPRIHNVPFGHQNSSRNVRISVDEVSSSHLTLTFYKSDEQIIGRRIEEKKYTYDISGQELNIVVNSTNGNIFNTARGPFIASNDIWELTFKITNESMFGLGEIPLKENTVKVLYSHKGGISSIPLIFAKSNGNYHGLLIDTVSPTEISIRSENQIIVRSITDWRLKFHLFVGPEPADIMRDVMLLTGTDYKIEYWMLGPHICSEQTTLQELQTYINNANSQNMPFDSHCGIAPPQFSNECNSTHVRLVTDGAMALRNVRRKFVPHVSPHILYTVPEVPDLETTTEIPQNKTIISNRTESCFDDDEYKQHIIHDPDGDNYYMGTVNGHSVIYPNYENISDELMQQLWVYTEPDAVVLENSWPLDESEKCTNQTHFYLPYFNENFEKAFEFTPKWNATQPERYLNTHNEYGNKFLSAFEQLNMSIPITSSSRWMNGNHPIHRQGIETTWASFHKELIEISLGGISGQWYWSSPVCGDTEHFNNVTQVRLCAKWYMASTYFPMMQIYSKEVRRDPLAFNGTDKAQMIKALNTRMSLLPYLYTVLQEGPLLRPMFYQFPSIEKLTNVTTQFSVGDSLLIVPNLHPDQSHVHVLMPPGQWFEFGSGLRLESNVGESITMATTEADFLTLIKGGSIIIKQTEVRSTTAETQRSPYTLLIALHCETTNATGEIKTTTEQVQNVAITDNVTDSTTEEITTIDPIITKCWAEGKFYMTPNLTILFEADANTLKVTAQGDDFDQTTWETDVWWLTVFGLKEELNNFDHQHKQDLFTVNFRDLQYKDEITYTFAEF